MPEYNVSGHYPFVIEADSPESAIARAYDQGGWEWEASEDTKIKIAAVRYEITEERLFASWEDSEWVEDVGNYLADGFESTVQAVADRIHEIEEEASLPLTFCFSWVGVLENGVDGANVEAYVGEGVYVAKYVELKHLTDDREATGRAQVLAIFSALTYEHDALVRYAAKKGLI